MRVPASDSSRHGRDPLPELLRQAGSDDRAEDTPRRAAALWAETPPASTGRKKMLAANKSDSLQPAPSPVSQNSLARAQALRTGSIPPPICQPCEMHLTARVAHALIRIPMQIELLFPPRQKARRW